MLILSAMTKFSELRVCSPEELVASRVEHLCTSQVQGTRFLCSCTAASVYLSPPSRHRFSLLGAVCATDRPVLICSEGFRLTCLVLAAAASPAASSSSSGRCLAIAATSAGPLHHRQRGRLESAPPRTSDRPRCGRRAPPSLSAARLPPAATRRRRRLLSATRSHRHLAGRVSGAAVGGGTVVYRSATLAAPCESSAGGVPASAAVMPLMTAADDAGRRRGRGRPGPPPAGPGPADGPPLGRRSMRAAEIPGLARASGDRAKAGERRRPSPRRRPCRLRRRPVRPTRPLRHGRSEPRPAPRRSCNTNCFMMLFSVLLEKGSPPGQIPT